MSSKNWVIHTISPVFVPKDKESPHNTGPGISIILVIQHSFVHTRNSIILHSFRFNTPDKKKHTPIDIQGVSLQPAAIHHSPLPMFGSGYGSNVASVTTCHRRVIVVIPADEEKRSHDHGIPVER